MTDLINILVRTYDQCWWPVVAFDDNFSDPNLTFGYSSFNIVEHKNLIYIMYAKTNLIFNPSACEVLFGIGYGLINVFDTNG